MALCAAIAPQVEARAAALRAGAGPVPAFLDGYHTGLWVTIALLAAGVLVSYLTLRPRAAAATEPAKDLTTIGEIEAIGESLGELVIPDELMITARGSDTE